MRLRLVAPAQQMHGSKRGLFPPLSLAMVAALTPDDWEIEVIDENVQHHDIDGSVDLVGMTAITAVAPRAYEIARQYREQGVRVVMGGMHASALPEEALQHVDAVVVGEAESVWDSLLEDARKGKLRGIYQSEERPCLKGLPSPRIDLFDPKRYMTVNLAQTSRGCPNNCSFCSVTQFFGKTYRTRPIDDVLEEVSQMKRRKTVLFVDDNIVGHTRHAKALFRELASMKIKWFGQSSLQIAQDDDLLDLAADSGCIGLFIGFESLVAKNLRRVGKGVVNRVEGFLDSINRIHDRGIGIEGAFIFGMDDDDPSVFERTVRFAEKSKLALAQFGILTPFPGTPLYDRMQSEDRIIVSDWSKYTISNVVSAPANLSRAALEEGFNWAYKEFYSYRSMLRRLTPSFRKKFWIFLGLNMVFRRITDRMIQARESIVEQTVAGES